MKSIEKMLAPVPIKDFLMAQQTVTETYRSEGGERSIERTLIILFRLFPKRGEVMASAIMFRMQALVKLNDHPVMRPWKIEGSPDGAALLSGAVMKAAAQHPIICTEKEWFFDPELFFSRVLDLSNREGRA
jgi:hypothetical protein